VKLDSTSRSLSKSTPSSVNSYVDGPRLRRLLRFASARWSGAVICPASAFARRGVRYRLALVEWCCGRITSDGCRHHCTTNGTIHQTTATNVTIPCAGRAASNTEAKPAARPSDVLVAALAGSVQALLARARIFPRRHLQLGHELLDGSENRDRIQQPSPRARWLLSHRRRYPRDIALGWKRYGSVSTLKRQRICSRRRLMPSLVTT
jgi:hypothetical protein